LDYSNQIDSNAGKGWLCILGAGAIDLLEVAGEAVMDGEAEAVTDARRESGVARDEVAFRGTGRPEGGAVGV
jgi:hypothetical protein